VLLLLASVIGASAWAINKFIIERDRNNLRFEPKEVTQATGLMPNVSPYVKTGTAPQPQRPTMPHLAYGSWTLRNAIDEGGYNWSNSVLKFSAQEPTSEGLRLRGTFTWRLNNEVVGTEEVAGFYIAATREISLEGQRVSDRKLAVGSYFAVLSANERELNDGRWGSSAQLEDPGTPGHWEASC
jgi:hypothetical protein